MDHSFMNELFFNVVKVGLNFLRFRRTGLETIVCVSIVIACEKLCMDSVNVDMCQ